MRHSNELAVQASRRHLCAYRLLPALNPGYFNARLRRHDFLGYQLVSRIYLSDASTETL